MIGLWDLCCFLSLLVLLVFSIIYSVKFFYYEQPIDTWDSWRWDDEFFTVAPIVAGVILFIVFLFYFCKMVLACNHKCHRRSQRHEFVPLGEINT